jgi:hypothetical protein
MNVTLESDFAAVGRTLTQAADQPEESLPGEQSKAIAQLALTGKAMLDAADQVRHIHASLELLERMDDQVADRVIKSCLNLQEQVQDQVRLAARHAGAVGGRSVEAMLQMLHEAARTLHQVAEDLRWEMLERQVDNDLADGRVSPAYDSVDDLLSALKGR